MQPVPRQFSDLINHGDSVATKTARGEYLRVRGFVCPVGRRRHLKGVALPTPGVCSQWVYRVEAKGCIESAARVI